MSSQGWFLRFKTKWILGRSCPPDERFISFPVASIRPSPTILYWANNEDAHVPVKSLWCPQAMVKHQSAARNRNWNGKKQPTAECYNGIHSCYTPCEVDIRPDSARLLRSEVLRAASWADSDMKTVSAFSAFILSLLPASELHFFTERFFCRFYNYIYVFTSSSSSAAATPTTLWIKFLPFSNLQTLRP